MLKKFFLFFILLLLVGCSSGSPVVTGETKSFTIEASNWKFEPSTITVNQGDTVALTIVSLDDGTGTGHGISISAFGVNEFFRGGETVSVSFVADKKGTFPFFCNVYCGEGHGAMKGSLVVK